MKGAEIFNGNHLTNTLDGSDGPNSKHLSR